MRERVVDARDAKRVESSWYLCGTASRSDR